MNELAPGNSSWRIVEFVAPLAAGARVCFFPWLMPPHVPGSLNFLSHGAINFIKLKLICINSVEPEFLKPIQSVSKVLKS
jgi:hypothetical protein